MSDSLPKAVTVLGDAQPAVWSAYQALGKACAESGPLDGRTRRLVKLALAIGGGAEGAVHSHVRQGLEEALSPDEIRHVALLAIPTLGFAKAMAARTWIDDILAMKES